jgi:hypothetical protein
MEKVIIHNVNCNSDIFSISIKRRFLNVIDIILHFRQNTVNLLQHFVLE